MATTLAQIRAKLQEQENNKLNGSSMGADNGLFAHWNMPENTITRVRFLPDANSKNPYFWLEKLTIKLPFIGVKGQADSKLVTVQVPCMEMWNESCPILTEVRTWFKDKSMEEMGRKYWKKKSYLFQGFVRENPVQDDKQPANPIRRFVISPQIFNLVKNALLDPELENMPTDYENGLDFNIKKTSPKGGYADYSTSSWARKESALSQAELAAIDQYGLFNLADFLPKKPTPEEVTIIREMFEASVNGELYDADRWAAHFKPLGLNTNNGRATPGDDEDSVPIAKNSGNDSVPVVKTQPTKPAVAASEDDDSPFVPEQKASPTVAKSSQRAEDILAMIRNRSKA
jgi:hypothetical protein